MKKFFKRLAENLKKDKLNIVIIALAVLVGVGGALLAIKGFKDSNPKNMTLSIGQGEAKIGETVKIPIEIINNKGIYMAEVHIDYNKENLAFVSYSVPQNAVFDLCNVNDNPGQVSLILEMQGKDAITNKNGVIVELEFKAKLSSVSGEYNLSINEDTMFIDYASNILSLDKKGGNITILEKDKK